MSGMWFLVLGPSMAERTAPCAGRREREKPGNVDGMINGVNLWKNEHFDLAVTQERRPKAALCRSNG